MNQITKILASGIVLLSLCVGCTNDPNLLSGVANVNGRPVEKGVLILTPDQAKGNSGQRVICDIVEGRFESSPITPGPNVAIVSVHKKTAPGDVLTPLDFSEFKMYEIDVDLPAAGSQKFEINIVVDHQEEDRQNDAGQQTGAMAREDSISDEAAIRTDDPDDSNLDNK